MNKNVANRQILIASAGKSRILHLVAAHSFPRSSRWGMGWVMEEGILGASLRAVLDDQLLARSGAPHRAQLASFSLSLREVGDRSICVATCAKLGLTALAESLRSEG